MKEGLDGGVLSGVRKFVQEKVRESRLPTKEGLGYESTVGIFGGRLVEGRDGELVYDVTGIVSRIDRGGDAVLRTFDEHVAKKPGELLRRHPTWFFGHFLPNPLRFRGSPSEIAENARRLGLEGTYVLHPHGIEIKRPSVYKKGIALQDIYRADQIGSEELNGIDRFEALAEAARYVRSVHDNKGAIGELLPSDVIFQNVEKGYVQGPILNLPDELYNSSKTISENAKKATDILDFMVSIGFEEIRRSNDWNEVKKALDTILENYGDKSVISVVGSLARRGRLVMLGDKYSARPVFTMHNKARLGFDEKNTKQLRDMVIESCRKYTDL